MSSKFSKFAITAGIASLGIAGIAAAPAAYAQGCTNGCQGVQGTVTVPSTITLALSSTSFAITATPGQAASAPAFTATVTSNSAYALSSYMYDQSVNPNSSSGNVWDQADAFTNGGTTAQTVRTIADADWTAATNGGSPVQFPASGTATASQSGEAFFNGTAITLASAGASAPGGDAYSEVLSVSVPGSQPPASYSGTVEFAAIGQS